MLFRAILSIMLQELQRAVGRKKKNQRRTVWDSGNQESGLAETKMASVATFSSSEK